MLANILFYIIFLSQIILVSYYYPKQILQRLKYLLKTYTPAEYPKLYPKPREKYEKMIRNYHIGNQFILIIGIVILFSIGLFDTSINWKNIETICLTYFFIQVIPIFLIELVGFSYFKLMRKVNSQSLRKAELKPRRLSDYVSPIYLTLAILSNLLCIAFFYGLHGFQFHISNDTIVIVVSLILSNTLYAATIYWNLYGKKMDPHRATKDRINQVETTIKSLVFMSIGASLFIMLTEGIDQYNLDFLAPVMMSLYLQFVVFIGLGYMLRKYKIKNIDFEVYKEDVSVNQ